MNVPLKTLTLSGPGYNTQFPNYTYPALHVYRLSVDVDSWNELMLNNLASETKQYAIRACCAVAGQTTHIALSNLWQKVKELVAFTVPLS